MKAPRFQVCFVVLVVCLGFAASAAAAPGAAEVRRGLEQLVAAPGGPPGAIATIYRDGKLTVLRAGRADVKRPGAPKPTDHMRIATYLRVRAWEAAQRSRGVDVRVEIE